MTDREQGFQLPLSVAIDRKQNRLTVGKKPPKRGEALKSQRELDSWWSEEMYDLTRQDIEAWFNNLGAQSASHAGLNVEEGSREGAAHDTINVLIRRLKSARGHSFSAQEIVKKAYSDASLVEETAGIQRGWVVNYLEKRFIPALSEAWELNSRYQNQLKASVRQGRLPKF